MVAYHRIDLNTGISGLGVSPTRVWVVDLTATPYTNRPLFTDNQILGFSPQWSADGRRIAIYDSNSHSVYIRDFTDDSTKVVPLGNTGSDAALSPDGNQISFARLMIDDQTNEFQFDLHLADVETDEVRDVFGPEEPVDDRESAWNPDGRHLVIARRYTDDRTTRARQVFLLDTDTGTTEELVFDERYFNGFFSWDPQGNQLAIYRFPELTATGESNSMGRPEVWTYALSAGELTQIAENAYMPQWVP
jgi:Tol biopolymer transport system component